MLIKHLFLHYDSDAQNTQPKSNKDWADIENAAIDTEFLDISCNAFSKIAFTQQLATLRVLEVSYNTTAISELELDAALLPNLQHLYAYQAKLQKISFKGRFDKLETLHLAENELQTFELGNFPQLKTLYLYKNPIQNIEKEIFDKEQVNVCEAVIALLKSRINADLEYLHQAKMILIGNGEVGKSSIVYRFKNKKGSLPAREKTQGIALGVHTLKGLPTDFTGLNKKIDFDFSIWDFGGQGTYREVQQLFCSRKALYIFVTAVNEAEDNQEYVGASYWLGMAKAFGHDKEDKLHSPVIFVLNKCDKTGNKEINEQHYKAFGTIEHYIKISCDPLDNFDALEKAIYKTLPKIGMNREDVFHKSFSKKWFNVKIYLNKKKHENYISLAEYQLACEKEEMNEAEARTWLDYLDRIGDLIYFKDNKILQDFIILNPLWVRDAIYQVLDSELIINANGVFRPEQFKFVWDKYNVKKSFTDKVLETLKLKKYTETEHKKLLELMLQYKFCYQTTDDAGKKIYVIPALFPYSKPTLPDEVNKIEYKIRFVYSPLIPAGTVNKLIVDLHKYIYRDYKWKNACILYQIVEGSFSFGEVQEKWQDNAVYLGLGKYNPAPIYELVYNELFTLNKELKEAKFLTNLDFEVQILDEEDNEYIPWKIAKKNPALEKYAWIEKEFSEMLREKHSRLIPQKRITKKELIEWVEEGNVYEVFEQLDKMNIGKKEQYNRLKEEYTAGFKDIDRMDFYKRLKVFIGMIDFE